MSTPEASPLNPQPGNGPDRLAAQELTDEQIGRLVAADIAEVLLDQSNQLLLDTLYEGSSFTPVIGEAVGIRLTGDTADDQVQLDPVRKGLGILRKEGGLRFERDDMPVTEVINAGDASKAREIATSTSVIQVVVAPEKMRAFLAKEAKKSL